MVAPSRVVEHVRATRVRLHSTSRHPLAGGGDFAVEEAEEHLGPESLEAVQKLVGQPRQHEDDDGYEELTLSADERAEIATETARMPFGNIALMKPPVPARTIFFSMTYSPS